MNIKSIFASLIVFLSGTGCCSWFFGEVEQPECLKELLASKDTILSEE